MFYLSFIFFYVAINWLILRSSFVKSLDVSKEEIIILYAIKVVSAVLYANYFATQDQIFNADTWTYFIESKTETDALFNNPKIFITDLFYNKYSTNGGLFLSTYSYWNDLKANMFIKIISLVNVCSNKDYYINILFFNWFFIFGNLVLYKCIKEFYVVNKYILIAASFLAPSFLFWCSAIHKDGIVFTALIFCIYSFIKIVNGNKQIKNFVVLGFSLILIFSLRNFYLLALFPFLITYYISVYFKINAIRVFSSVSIFCFTFLMLSGYFNPTSFLLNSIVQKHNDFLLLEGNTKFITPELISTPNSFISFLPFAMKSSFFRPYFSLDANPKLLIASIENLIYIGLFFASIVKVLFTRDKDVLPITLLFFSISIVLYLLIGYTVCFDAAIIRYRSCFLPLFLVACVLVLFGKPKEVNYN